MSNTLNGFATEKDLCFGNLLRSAVSKIHLPHTLVFKLY